MIDSVLRCRCVVARIWHSLTFLSQRNRTHPSSPSTFPCTPSWFSLYPSLNCSAESFSHQSPHLPLHKAASGNVYLTFSTPYQALLLTTVRLYPCALFGRSFRGHRCVLSYVSIQQPHLSQIRPCFLQCMLGSTVSKQRIEDNPPRTKTRQRNCSFARDERAETTREAVPLKHGVTRKELRGRSCESQV